MQPTQSSMSRRTPSGIAPRVTTSETAKRPPGLSTRKASRRTRSLSAERLITQFEMITSTELSGSGICSISPLRNLNVGCARFGTVAFGKLQHLVGHVESVSESGRADPLCGQQDVDSAAAPEVEHGFSGFKL